MKRFSSVALLASLALLVVIPGCGDPQDDDDVDVTSQALADEAAGVDPCQDPKIRSKANVKATQDGHHFSGSNGPDVIIGTDGVDEIFGNGGDDIICGLGGDDVIEGGDGKDRIYAGPGNDLVHGRAGSDTIFGGDGDDVLFGDILDDHIYGEDGNDVLIGGHGTDIMNGGKGNDFLRGDTGNDSFTGGEGHDIVSFATAMPPGQPEIVGGKENEFTGVEVKFPGGKGCSGHDGCANGDGGNEPLDGVEEIWGSTFKDNFVNAGATKLQSGFGESTATPTSYVFVDARKNQADELIDVGLVILGSTGHDDFTVVGSGETVDVTNHSHAIAPGVGCTSTGADSVHCDVSKVLAASKRGRDPFHFLVGWADDGDDEFEIKGFFPKEFEAHVNGGEGSDHLIGGGEADVLFTGVSGTDHLEGNGGDDALLSESHHTDIWDAGDRPKVADYKDGPDTLDAGDGDDQLVADYVCGGHKYIGGDGDDIAGFARSGYHPIHAQLSGPSSLKTDYYGYAANLDLCGNDKSAWTEFVHKGNDADLEILEASDGPDYLWGDDRDNTIWGRGGGDHIFGLGGDDLILGAGGNDVIDGGSGKNTISYGQDN